MDRVLGVEIGQPLTVPRVAVCNRKGIVIEFHVWTEDKLKCSRCGYERAPR